MRVLIINAIYGSKSSGRSIAEIKTCLEKEQNETFIAVPQKIEGNGFYQIGGILDHKIHAVMSRITGLQGYFSISATKELIHYIDKIQPDIIHMQVVHGNYLNFGVFMKYIASKKIPIVFVLDDCWYFTGKCCHYIADHCDKWKSECHHCIRKKDDNPSWFFDFSKKMYHDKKQWFANLDKYAVVAVSEWLKKEVKQSILSNAPILTRIYNSIDIEQYQYRKNCGLIKRKLGLSDKKVILGVAAAWEDHNGLSKGINLFIDLADRLSDEYVIVLVGSMNSDTKLPENVYNVEFVDSAEEMSEYYSMADVFVQMSSEETFGKVTAEALACGTPAIVFNSTANPELIGENCGYVVENKNVEQVYEKILCVMDNGREYYTKYCRQFAVDNFDSKVNIQRYIEVYRKLIGV